MTPSTEEPYGDMTPEDFRIHAHRLVDWIADYLAHSDRYPVLSRVSPGQIRNALPTSAPESPEPFEKIFDDFERILLPGVTHWNHPGFMAYFAITGSAPGVLGELLCAALNVQAMLWRTSPSATELEVTVLSWLRQLLGLPSVFEGVIYDTASISSLHALAAARERAIPEIRTKGLYAHTNQPELRIYCSEQAHSSIDKAVILLGLGHRALRRIPVDSSFRMEPNQLASAIIEDREANHQPFAVVATVGTTSTTSVDPVTAIADICTAERLWLHVDAAYAGVAAIVPKLRGALDGCERADSIVVNPHKWLFTPFDLSTLYCRHMSVLRSAFSLTPEYLQSNEGEGAVNLMDTGIQLGRRFRALKLWMVLRSFGAKSLRSHLQRHVDLARQFSTWVDSHTDFERVAPVPFSVVCFRANPSRGKLESAALDTLNEKLLKAVNSSGEVFLSHTRLHGQFVLRLAIGHVRTNEDHIKRAWLLLQEHATVLFACQSSDHSAAENESLSE